MILLGLFIIPLLSGVMSFLIKTNGVRRVLLVVTALLHLGLTLLAWIFRPEPVLGGWIGLDAAGLLFLCLVSVLFLAAVVYVLGYLRQEEKAGGHLAEDGFLISNTREGMFTGCFVFFLATMSLVTLSQHLGLLWVAIEATTLSSAPLIYFHRHHRSLEAAWKYLLICSVGIALALFGNFLLSVSAETGTGHGSSLLLSSLLREGPSFNPAWLKASLILFFVGYGTKMGLAPMHTWLPDAHSEAPSVVSALLSGALLNCAFLGILRAHQIGLAAGLEKFDQSLFIAFGLVSVALAAVFSIRQADFKRLLAYSSVEHMGILSFGMGLGGAGVFGGLYHAINHSLAKAGLFFLAGNIIALYQAKSVEKISGLLKVLPYTGVFWVLGFFAITGSPPFGTFFSKFMVLKAAIAGGHTFFAFLFLAFVVLLFCEMSAIILKMAYGQVPVSLKKGFGHDTVSSILPSAVFCVLLIVLGLYIPGPLFKLLSDASHLMGGGP